MPVDYKKYSPLWKIIRMGILARAHDCCEGSPAYPDCRAPNHKFHPVTGSMVVLTIAHLDHDPSNNNFDNLRAWCQRCHLKYDEAHHQATRASRKAAERRSERNE